MEMVELNEKAHEAAKIARAIAMNMLNEGTQWRLDPRYILILCDAVEGSSLPAPDDGLVERLRAHADTPIEDDLKYIQIADDLMRDAATALRSKDAELQHLRADAENPNKGMWTFWNEKARELSEQVEQLSVKLEASALVGVELSSRLEAAEQQVQKLTAENERLREAMEPFAKVAEHDIGEDEDDADIFWPISNARYSMAGRLRVGHLRAARSALETQEGGK